MYTANTVFNGVQWNAMWSCTSTGNCGARIMQDLRIWGGTTRWDLIQPGNRDVPPDAMAHLFEAILTALGEYKKYVTVFASPVDYRAVVQEAGDKRTSDIYTNAFVQWLIDIKKEFVITTPVFANMNYARSPASLNQISIWFPERLVKDNRVMRDSWQVFNEPDLSKTAKALNRQAELFEENFSPHYNGLVTNRLARAKIAWETDRGFVNGKPLPKQNLKLSWGT